MNAQPTGRALVMSALLAGGLSLGMGTCGTDPGPTSGTPVSQLDEGFATTVTPTGPTTSIPTPSNDPTSCGSTGTTCACEEGYEPDEQGNCVPIPDAPPPPPDPGTPGPAPDPGSPPPPPPPVTTWGDVQPTLNSCGFGGCHGGGNGQPISMAEWQANSANVQGGLPGHTGGPPSAALVSLFASWEAGGFQP